MAASAQQHSSAVASALLVVVLVLVLVFFLVVSAGFSERVGSPGALSAAATVSVFRGWNRAPASSLRHRKLLQQEQHPGRAEVGGDGKGLEGNTNRMGEGDCGKDDIAVYQAASSPLPNGIPAYSVQVINTCLGAGCGGGIAHVHLSCGWFSSARLINPRVFRRLRFDDCLVNDGRAIPAGGAVSFQYANSYPYRLTVASVSCLAAGSP